jgi:phosphoglycerol transferase MdoB-like AlkP superfamily enzyme
MDISVILMWIFTILIVIGLFLTYRTIKDQNAYYHKMEGPILILIGLLLTLAEKRLSNLADIIKRHLKKPKSQTNSTKKENPDEIIS